MEHVHRGIGTVYSLLDGEYEFIEAKISKIKLVNKKIRIIQDIRIIILRKEQVIIPRSNFFLKRMISSFLAKREELL